MNLTGQRSDCSLIWGKGLAKYVRMVSFSAEIKTHYCTTGVTFIRSINVYSNMGYTLPRHIPFDYAHCFSTSSSHGGLLLRSPPHATHNSVITVFHLTFKPQFHVSAFCIFCNFICFLYCPGQMPIWTVPYYNWFCVSPNLHFPTIYISCP